VRIFLIYPGHTISTIDVAIGYERALRELGHEVLAYNYHDSLAFYGEALEYWKQKNPRFDPSQAEWLRISSEMAVVEAVRFVPQVVIIVCGFALHRSAFDLLGRNLCLPLVLILTESPYVDPDQRQIVEKGHIRLAFTNERRSVEYLAANEAGAPVVYLPHSYDPARHFPQAVGQEYRSDVFFCGTMYEERRQLLEGVDWTGIDVRIVGPELGDGEVQGGLANEELARFYCGTKLALNMHRTSCGVFDERLRHIEDGAAWSLGPRAYEIAACGAFQVCDDSRGELRIVFGDAVPTYRTAEDLEWLIRMYLADEVARVELARRQRERVQPCTFRARAEAILLPMIEEVLYDVTSICQR